MSDDFGKSVRFPQPEVETEAAQKARFPQSAHLENARYNDLLRSYFLCVTKYLNDFEEPQMLEQQLKRRDLDTVCAYELYQMKKEFNDTKVLNMSSFVVRQ